MRSLISMAMLFAMVLFVVGCGGAAETENGDTATTPEETPGYDEQMEDAADGETETPAEETPAEETPAEETPADGGAAAPEAGAESDAEPANE